MPRGDAYRNGRVHVLSEKCSTCVFRSGNLMHLQAGRLKDLAEQNLQTDSALTCHQTLEYGEYEVDGNAICRGFYDSYANEVTPLRMAQALDMITEIDPPTKKKRR